MAQHEPQEQNAAPSAELATNHDEQTNPRRQFLLTGVAAAGSLVLGMAARESSAAEPAASAPQAIPAEITLKLKDKQNAELAKIGGSTTIKTADDTIIVARIDANTFVACSAICTHRGCTVGYVHSEKQFVCPCHGARFGLDGTVQHGPAKKNLKSYPTDAAAVVSLGTPAANTTKTS